MLPEMDHLVRDLDPLGIDEQISGLWRMNKGRDVNALCGLLRTMVDSIDNVYEMKETHSYAAMRDLGMVMGSLRRHGVDPVAGDARLEETLCALGARTGMVPRDTVHHMTRWNPEGPRQRTFTGQLDEKLLDQSVKQSLESTMAAIDLCARLLELTPGTPEFAMAATKLTNPLRALEESVDVAVSGVSPQFFGTELRPYLESIRINGVDYYGPAAAHVPVALVDQALWASDGAGEQYRGFIEQIRPYGIPEWDRYYDAWGSGPSLMTVLTEKINHTQGTPGEPLRIAAEALSRSLRALSVFRGKHMTLARRIYTPTVTALEKGSAGGDSSLLGNIVRSTLDNSTQLRKLVPHATSRS